MPETGFRRQERGEVSRGLEAVDVARRGFGLVRRRPVLLLLVAAAFFAGAYTEGFDRLSEAHFIRDVGLPLFAGLSTLWWCAVLGAAGMVIGLASSQYLVRRLRAITRRELAALLRVVCAVEAAAIVAFGLAAGFALAVAAFLTVKLGRSLMSPVYMTWLNQSIDDSSVRATVISISGQADAIGQVAGGPGIGAVGRAFSIRAALVTAGVVLTPALALYARALRHRGAEPELEQLPAAGVP
jgi:DHA3 family tetracycline resistance protein-like MFS transporter